MADIASGILSAGGAILGSIFGGGYEDQAKQYEQDALNQYLEQNDPNYVQVDAQKVGGMDPQMRAAMLQALQNYQKVGQSGFTSTDQAALSQSQRQIADSARGNQEALLQRADSQGGLGSGNQLVAQMMAQQGQADRSNQAGNQLAIEGRNRALQAYGQSANIAGQMQQRDDAIARFNAQNSLAAQMYNSQLGRQQWQDRDALAAQRAGAYGTAAGQQHGYYNQAVGMWSGIGQGLGTAIDNGANGPMNIITNPGSGGGGQNYGYPMQSNGYGYGYPGAAGSAYLGQSGAGLMGYGAGAGAGSTASSGIMGGVMGAAAAL